jgi:hypothetical protein
MRNLFSAILAGGLLTSLPGNFMSAGDKKPTNDDPVNALAPFIGEWHVEGKWSSGDKLKARGTYEWGLGKKILIAKTFVMDGDKEYQRYESIMAWHPKKKSLYEITFAFDGDIKEVLIDNKERGAFQIGYTPFHADQPENLRQILRFKDQDHFLWTVSFKKGDTWVQLIEATWVRKGRQ